jgi:hypothetical protein
MKTAESAMKLKRIRVRVSRVSCYGRKREREIKVVKLLSIE